MDIEILKEERLRYWCGRLKFPAEAVNVLAEIASTIRRTPALMPVFEAVYTKLAIQGDWELNSDQHPIDPLVAEVFGEQETLFYLLAYLAALPGAEQEYLRRGISLEIFDATMPDISNWLLYYHEVYGKWMFKQFHWIWHHLSGQLFRLGRLQFTLGELDYGITGLKNRATGEYVLLADPELPLRSDGYAYGAGDLPAAGDSWKPVLEVTDQGWRGHAVTPYGYVLPEPAFFDKTGWEQVLQKGDTVLDMHIPRRDRFSLEDCRDSLRQAVEFFGRHYPDRPYKAGFCHTWFFSPQLQQILPPESNIVRFQREFHLFPSTGKLGFLWFYVFGEQYPDRASAPSNTFLQRTVLDWLDRGGEIFDLPGVMFHGPVEWGSQIYMRQWDQRHPTG